MSEEVLYKTSEVAKILMVKEQTLYNWRHAGRGPKSIKIEGAVRYRAADVDAYIKEASDVCDRD